VSGPEKKVLHLRPIFGLQATITTPEAATDGSYFEIDDVLEPGGHTTDHYHPAQRRPSRFSTARWRSSVTVVGTKCQLESPRPCRLGRPMRSETRARPRCGS
jgi:hypothetical protein